MKTESLEKMMHRLVKVGKVSELMSDILLKENNKTRILTDAAGIPTDLLQTLVALIDKKVEKVNHGEPYKYKLMHVKHDPNQTFKYIIKSETDSTTIIETTMDENRFMDLYNETKKEIVWLMSDLTDALVEQIETNGFTATKSLVTKIFED